LGEIAGADVREALRAGAIRGDVRHRYPLAAEAHRDLESRRSTGSLVLLP
jgi:NADPH:quinone reductase-like Zn-dependent oxidoreductase